MNRDGVLQRLKQYGLKLTPQRLEILRIVMEAERALTAQEVVQAVRAAHPHVSLDTVYRNLALLTRVGLVNQVNLQNRDSTRFEFQGEGEHHHHFICLECGKTFCVESCPTPMIDARPPEDPGFKVVGHAFEMYGFCTACQAPG